MKNTVLLLGVGALALWLLSKARTLTSLQFVPRNLSSSGGSLQLTVGVQNPTSTGLTIRSLVGGVYVDNNMIATVSNFTPVSVLPNAETPLTISVAPSIFGIVADVVSSIQNNFPVPGKIELRATANVDNQAVPVKVPFT